MAGVSGRGIMRPHAGSVTAMVAGASSLLIEDIEKESLPEELELSSDADRQEADCKAMRQPTQGIIFATGGEDCSVRFQ